MLPLGINKNTAFFGRPVGNSPELMPMDATLNKDVDDGVRYHVALTYNLAHDDPKKFSLSTPKRGSSAYLRVWEQCPPSNRIIEDTDKFLKALTKISNANGVAITDVPRKGHRHDAGSISLKKRGGVRMKREEAKVRWVHEDARQSRVSSIQSSIRIHSDAPKEEKRLKKMEDDNGVFDSEKEIMNFFDAEKIISTRPCQDWV